MHGVSDEGAFAHVVAPVVDLEAAHAADEAPAHAGARADQRQVAVAAEVEVLTERDARVQTLQPRRTHSTTTFQEIQFPFVLVHKNLSVSVGVSHGGERKWLEGS